MKKTKNKHDDTLANENFYTNTPMKSRNVALFFAHRDESAYRALELCEVGDSSISEGPFSNKIGARPEKIHKNLPCRMAAHADELPKEEVSMTAGKASRARRPSRCAAMPPSFHLL